MLSSKKSTLIHCLLKSIASDVNYNFQPTSSVNGGQHMANNKSAIVNRFNLLWSYLLSKCCCAGQIFHNPNTRHPTSQLIEEVTRRLHCLSKRQLRHLWKVIQGGGSYLGECILVQQNTKFSCLCSCKPCDEQHSPMVHQSVSDEIDPQLLICLLWRWSRSNINCQLLRPLPWCLHHSPDHRWDDISKQHSVCINPYHWSLLISDCSYENFLNGQAAETSLSSKLPDNNQFDNDCQLEEQLDSQSYQYYPMPSSTPPPSYSEANNPLPSVTFPCKGDSPKSIDSDNGLNSTWCRLSYWEERRRVGKQFSVTTESFNVFTGLMEGDGLCLESLFHSEPVKITNDISRIRKKIGLGVSLFRDTDNSVWLYNRSSVDIFVNSLTLNLDTILTESSTNLAVKIFPGHIVKVYDYKAVQRLKSYLQSSTHTPVDGYKTNRLQHLLNSNSFCFSFVKGFGGNYSRQEIMQCPCWLEVILDFTNHFSPTHNQ